MRLEGDADREWSVPREPITIDFTDAPIREVAAAFASCVLVEDDVDVRVTWQAKTVPWDQVLEHVVRKYLRYSRR